MRRLRTTIAAGACAVAVVTAGVGAPPAAALSPLDRGISSAVAYASRHGVRVGISILDLDTGRTRAGGRSLTQLPSASVVKVFMAIFLLRTGRMQGAAARRAWPMITRSDNTAFVSLLRTYFRGSARALFGWMQAHYAVAHLGAPTAKNRCWGSTRITAQGMTRLYGKAVHDTVVGPWLLRAMHHVVRRLPGFDQGFGIPSVDRGAGVKQGWSSGCSAIPPVRTVLNSTGFVAHDRYAVAILTTSKLTIPAQRKVIDEVARRALARLEPRRTG